MSTPACLQVGAETFRLCRQLVDGVLLVDNAAISAAIKDVFNETRSILEPAGAVAVAGAKAWLKENGHKVRWGLVWHGLTQVLGRAWGLQPPAFPRNRLALCSWRTPLCWCLVVSTNSAHVSYIHTLESMEHTHALRHISVKYAMYYQAEDSSDGGFPLGRQAYACLPEPAACADACCLSAAAVTRCVDVHRARPLSR